MEQIVAVAAHQRAGDALQRWGMHLPTGDDGMPQGGEEKNGARSRSGRTDRRCKTVRGTAISGWSTYSPRVGEPGVMLRRG